LKAGPFTYGVAPVTLAATSNSTGALSYTVVSGPATISGVVMTITGAGTVVVQVSQAATATLASATATAAMTVNTASLTLTANNTARVYGAANPAFTGTVTGGVNGDVLTESFTTTATASSIVGGYPIVPSVTGTNIASYTIFGANGVLTISQAGTATSLALSNSNLTLTANVVSLTSGTPTGTVGFYEGQTLVGTGTLSGGVAAYTTSGFPTGDVVVTAEYSGDVDFTQSQSPPILMLSVGLGLTSLTASTDGSATDTLTLTPLSGFTGTVQFSCAGLPAHSTCSFSPSSVTFAGGSSPTTVTATIQTGVVTAALEPWSLGDPNGVIRWAAIVGLPGLLGLTARRRRSTSRWTQYLLPLLLLCCLDILGACNRSSPSSGGTAMTPAGIYNLQIMTTGSGGLSQTSEVTLAVQ
jgi:hypothetical protein